MCRSGRPCGDRRKITVVCEAKRLARSPPRRQAAQGHGRAGAYARTIRPVPGQPWPPAHDREVERAGPACRPPHSRRSEQISSRRLFRSRLRPFWRTGRRFTQQHQPAHSEPPSARIAAEVWKEPLSRELDSTARNQGLQPAGLRQTLPRSGASAPAGATLPRAHTLCNHEPPR